MKLNHLMLFSFAAALATSTAHAVLKDGGTGAGESAPAAGESAPSTGAPAPAPAPGPDTGGNSNGNGGGSADNGTSVAVTWSELKQRCLHPDQFNTQRAPQKIVIQCTERSLDYIPAGAQQIPLQGARTVVTAVLSDKFHVAASAMDLPVMPKGANCLQYKEVERAYTIEQPLSCEQILGLKEDLSAYCVNSIGHAKGDNFKPTESRDTGRVIDACGGQGVPYPTYDKGEGKGEQSGEKSGEKSGSAGKPEVSGKN